YTFTDLLPGLYRVTVTRPDGYDRFSVQNAGSDDALDSDVTAGAGATSTTADITLVSGVDDFTWDAGLYQLGTLGDRVWDDRNGNGVQDAGEPGVPNVRLDLNGETGAGATVTLTTTTDASGIYTFTNLVPGTYTVTVTAPAGYRLTAQNQGGNDATDSDADPTTGVMARTDITSGELDNTWDAGLYRPASIGNFVWLDRNANGVQDAGEPGVAGVTLTLTGTDGLNALVTAITTTNASGFYSFTGLLPGVYTVTATLPDGYRFTVTGRGTSATDSDANPTTGVMSGTTLVSGEYDDSWDVGVYRPLSLGDLVFFDRDNSGTYEPATDSPLAGALVELFLADGTTVVTNVNGVTVVSQTTTATGLYTFTSLRPDAYMVRVTPPDGYRSSDDIATTANPDNNVNNDDNGIGSSSTGIVSSGVITLSSGLEPTDGGDSNLTLDFGFYRPLTLGNLVFHDRDNSGAYDAGIDSPLDGALVELLRNGSVVTDVTGATVSSQLTDATGLYTFTNLRPGAYTVRVTPPEGYRSSDNTVTDPNNNVDNDDNGLGNSTAGPTSSGVITLTSGMEPTDGGDTNLTLDFGFYRPLTLGNLVFHDRDNSGTYVDGTDIGLAGATVELLRNGSVVTNVNGANVSNQTTTATGLYTFTNLRPGDYTVRVTPPAGYRSSDNTVADPNNNQDNDDNGLGDSTAGATTSGVITLTSGEEPTDAGDSNLTLDFGFYHPLTLGNLIFHDRDNSGTYVAGTDIGLAGATVELLRNGSVVTDVTGADVLNQTTTSTGIYTFTNLRPGDYTVRVTPPAGYRSSDNTVADPNNNEDNDDNGLGDSTAGATTSGVITLTSGQEPINDGDTDANTNLTLDFGFYRPLSLGDLVFFDRDNSGTYNSGDSPLQGATVAIFFSDGTTPATNLTGTLITSITTGADGLYRFTDLKPNGYLVQVTAPEGYRSSTDIASTPNPNNNTNDDDNGLGTERTARSNAIMLTSGQEPVDDGDTDPNTNLTLDFGFFQPSSLGDRVWLDLNQNGIQDNGERGVAGITVTLRYATAPETVIVTTTTDSDGFYRFDMLGANDYLIAFALPTGYTFSPTGTGTLANDSNANVATGRTATITLNPGINDLTWDAGIFTVPELTKALAGTSSLATSGSNVTLGEVITYTLTISLAEGIFPSLVVTDTLPSGLSYLTGSTNVITTGFNGTLPAYSLTGPGSNGGTLVLNWNAPVTVTTDNNPANNSFRVQLQARVRDVPGNSGLDPQTTLTNRASIAIGNSPTITSNQVDVTVVEPRLELDKQFSQATAYAGETVTVTLTVTNTGTSPAHDVVIVDPLPTANFSAVSPGTTPSGFAYNTVISGSDTIVRYTGGPIAAGTTRTFTFQVTLAGDLVNGTVITNTATITQSTSLPDDDPNEREEPDTSDDDTITIVAPDLTITKNDGVSTVAPGDLITYTLSYTNLGTLAATGVVITETVPVSTSFVAPNTWSCSDGGSAGATCTTSLETLAAGASGSITFTVRLASSVPAGFTSITNTVTIADDGQNGPEIRLDNNDDDEVTPVIAAPDLVITKTDDNITVTTGDLITYTLTYTNVGNQDATGVVITETVPTYTTFITTTGWSCEGGTCTYDVGDLAVNITGTVSFVVQVDASLPAGVNSIFNTVVIADDGSNGDDPTPENNEDDETTPITAAPNLVITKTDGGISTVPGG
ncbi:SdrD B-like domain-containing protein, partial [Candidatus Chloroploca asiatica]|uniref:SdrD B-like domain-containing protein n=1 Tax=Candidatus Chloroploca asiatica TaxID=1506545 RepID=UPI00114441B5